MPNNNLFPTPAQSFELDRRQMLTAAVPATVAIVTLTIHNRGVAYAVKATQQSHMAVTSHGFEAGGRMARRLQEIASRNLLRQEAGLPLLSIEKELRRMKKVELAAELHRFGQANDAAIREQIGWRPRSFFESLLYSNEYERLCAEKFQAAKRTGNWVSGASEALS